MTSKGYIDKDTIYHFVYIVLNRPYGYLDEMDMEEFNTLYPAYVNKTKEEYQMQVYIQAAGVASAMSGEMVSLFGEQESDKTEDNNKPEGTNKPKQVEPAKGTIHYREKTLSELESIFN